MPPRPAPRVVASGAHGALLLDVRAAAVWHAYLSAAVGDLAA